MGCAGDGSIRRDPRSPGGPVVDQALTLSLTVQRVRTVCLRPSYSSCPLTVASMTSASPVSMSLDPDANHLATLPSSVRMTTSVVRP